MPRTAAAGPYAAPPAEWPALTGFSDAAVRERTGRSWAEWVQALDAIGAHTMSHRDIARHLREEHDGVSGWWSQAVTVGYERIRGLRDVGQRRAGSYEANRSRTFPVDVATLYAAFADARRRKRWLPDGPERVRTATVPKSLRLDWHDGSHVQCWFEAKGPAKATVSVAQVKLPTREALEAARAFWDERLGVLREQLGATER